MSNSKPKTPVQLNPELLRQRYQNRTQSSFEIFDSNMVTSNTMLAEESILQGTPNHNLLETQINKRLHAAPDSNNSNNKKSKTTQSNNNTESSQTQEQNENKPSQKKATPSIKTKEALKNAEVVAEKLDNVQRRGERDDPYQVLLQNQQRSTDLLMKQMQNQENRVARVEKSLQNPAVNSSWSKFVYPTIIDILKHNKNPTAEEIKELIQRQCEQEIEELSLQSFEAWWICARAQCLKYARDVRAKWNSKAKDLFEQNEKTKNKTTEQKQEMLQKYLVSARLEAFAEVVYKRVPTPNDKAWVYYVLQCYVQGKRVGEQAPRSRFRMDDITEEDEKQQEDPEQLLQMILKPSTNRHIY